MLQREILLESSKRARTCAERLTLDLRTPLRSGMSGALKGNSAGSSIEFYDHRSYAPGDDPRHIDWRAFARTKNVIVKLFSQELAPRVDAIVDLSASMFLTAEKSARALELFFFVVESTARLNGSLRSFGISGDAPCKLIEGDLLDPESYRIAQSSSAFPVCTTLPLRADSLRIIISDLLFPGAPHTLLASLAGGRGRAVILCPFAEEEERPAWEGSCRLVDIEDGVERTQTLDRTALERYHALYREHFEVWRSESMRYQIGLCRVPAALPLEEALLEDGFRTGVLRLWG